MPLAESAAASDFCAFTVNELAPVGVETDVDRVSVVDLLVSVGEKLSELEVNDAVTPEGNADVMLNRAVNAPEEPEPVPLLTVIV